MGRGSHAWDVYDVHYLRHFKVMLQNTFNIVTKLDVYAVTRIRQLLFMNT